MRIWWAIAAFAAWSAAIAGAQQQRGVAVSQPARGVVTNNGDYYALIIGINAYPHLPPLKTAAGDAQSIDQVLRQRYGFQTTVLLDDRATRNNILNALEGFRGKLHDNDNLLIYYAGHGAEDGGKAYWVPVDADSPANWIIADEVTKEMRVIPARHILVISDSCYSGGLALSRAVTANTVPTDRANYIQTMINSKSRILISSGRDEPVADGGSGGHSVFANAILNGLRSTPDAMFTASNLFTRYVQEAVVGGSTQVPLFQFIQESSHEYGDFVFVAHSGAVAAAPPSSTSDRRGTAPPVTAGGGNSLPPHKSKTRLAADGRAAAAPPLDRSGDLPLTDYRVALLEYRDWPEMMSDQALYDIAKWQVTGEKSVRTLLDQKLAGTPEPGEVLNPKRKTFLFEWQKEIETDPSFAASALLPVFMRPDADWSFLRKQKDWDENYDAYVYVFLFDPKKIEGGEADFVARDLTGVVKKQLQMAAAKAPVKLYFDVRLQSNYDIGLGKIRFIDQNQPTDIVDLLQPTKVVKYVPLVRNLPAPTDRDPHTFLPDSAKGAAVYNWSQGFTEEDEYRPSAHIYGSDPTQAWRKSIHGNTQGFPLPALGALAFDRQLKLNAIAFDVGRAQKMGLQALRNLRARVHIAVERVDRMQYAYERQLHAEQALLFAKVTKIDILGPNDEVVASIAASGLPAPAK